MRRLVLAFALLFAAVPSNAAHWDSGLRFLPTGTMPLFQVVCSSTVGTCGAATGGGVSLSANNTWTGTNAFNALVSMTTNGNALQMMNQSQLTFGNTPDSSLFFDTAQTPDTLFLGLGTTGRSLVIARDADKTFDFAHALPTNPTLFIHSAAQSTTQWISLSHNGTNAIVDAGAGELRLGGLSSFTNGNFLAVGGSGPEIYGSGGTLIAIFNTNGFDISTGSVANGLTMGATVGTHDVIWTRDSAATWQAGADVNGAAVNQTIKAHDGITGTDVKGAGLALKPGLGTGAAVSGAVETFRDITKATGTAAQTYGQATISCPTKILSNTSATAQTIATITTTTTTAGSVTMDYAVTANNGTLQDQDSGMVKVSWGNNAGTVSATMTAVTLQSDQDASGTLATTPTATVATNVVSIKVTPTWVTIVPTSVVGYATFTVHASDSVVCQ